ncbi:MAG: tetratricopeptide repeat protein [Zoogloeaceae bacterium]|nr:tetratricopeptide repeat protein [Zoogloeaceae bacterium]
MRRPLVMAFALAIATAVIYGVWMVWQTRQLEMNNVATAFSPPVSSSPPVEPVPAEIPATAPVSAHKPLVAPLPASVLADVADDEAEATTEKTGIVFIAHTGSAVISTPLQAAQSALTQGDIEAARAQFFNLLKTDPHHLDALLGLAAIALRQNEPETAWRFYQTAWTAHPQDARVQAGMLALLSAVGQLDPQRAESRLKNLIAAQPQAAAPHFALGNLLAAQTRWAEAQAAYFEACRLDRHNPDYRFNLAVSLDALRQSRLAATHYQAALTAAETAPANFDTAEARARLTALQAEDAP